MSISLANSDTLARANLSKEITITYRTVRTPGVRTAGFGGTQFGVQPQER